MSGVTKSETKIPGPKEEIQNYQHGMAQTGGPNCLIQHPNHLTETPLAQNLSTCNSIMLMISALRIVRKGFNVS